uniref:Uncharacterized protein n=1 Tax=viral metagenome TaxID=1070528 RepID=A0A6C0J2K9_9ZZZZ
MLLELVPWTQNAFKTTSSSSSSNRRSGQEVERIQALLAESNDLIGLEIVTPESRQPMDL